jgi:putative endonuclease
MRATKSQPSAGNEAAASRRRKRERAGRLAELLAAAFLVAKGYRILGRRVRTRLGEIDLIAVRGRRLAFVEVKYRDDAIDPAMTVSRRQSDGIARAAEQWARSRPAYRSHTFGLDIVFVSPWRLPRHLKDGLQPI